MSQPDPRSSKKQTSHFISVLEKKYRHANPVKTLWYLFTGDYRRLTLALLMMIIKTSPIWVIPIVTANIINIILNPATKSFSALIPSAIFMAVLYIQNIPTHVAFYSLMMKAVRGMGIRIRFAVVKRLQELSFSFHDSFRSGRLQSKILRDVEAVETLSEQIFQSLLINILGLIFALVVTMIKQPAIGFFFLGSIPIFFIILKIFRRPMIQRNRELRTELEGMSAKMSDMIEMIPVTRSHGAEEMEIANIYTHFEGVKTKSFRLDMLNAFFASSTWVTFMLFQFLCLLVTAYMALKGKIPVGDVVMYQGFYSMITNSISGLLYSYPMFTRGFESIRSIGEILECPDLEQNQGKKGVTSVSGEVVFEQVSFSYAPQSPEVLRDISISVKPGECIAFVGESGAGKSSMINLLIGFRRPTKGRILLDGIDMEAIDMRQYRRFLAVVPQQTILFSGSVRDNITYGLSGVNDERVWEALNLACADLFVRALPDGLNSLIGEHGGKLSGGQRQRIAIARAMIRNPRLIVFDEATSSLDVASESQIQQAMTHLVKGRTTFIVAHRLSTIRTADRIVVFKAGQIVEMGTYAELMEKKEEFYRLKTLYIS